MKIVKNDCSNVKIKRETGRNQRAFDVFAGVRLMSCGDQDVQRFDATTVTEAMCTGVRDSFMMLKRG
jgi:hypothetical protein